MISKFPLSIYLLGTVCLIVLRCAQLEKENLAAGNSQTNAVAASAAKAGVYLADEVVEAPGSTGSGYGNANLMINGVRGSGATAGGTDVYSLEQTGPTTHVVLGWSGKKVKNVAGADFIVYENAFNVSPSPARFMELIVVEVSNDNTNYCGFAPDYTNAVETTYSNDPGTWLRFAGKTPVIYNVDAAGTNFTAVELFTDADANSEGDLGGGDMFNLDNLSDSNMWGIGCDTTLRNELQTNGFRYLKLTAAPRRVNSDTAARFVHDAISSGPDIDGVVARSIE
jgi:hypothetical protein